MTYCLSLHCREGIIFFSDSRTSAGVDNITIHSKMRVFAKPGDRVFCLLSSGNLSITQSITALIERDLVRCEEDGTSACLLNQHGMYETVRYLGERVREVYAVDGEALNRAGLLFNVNLIFGGQIAGGPPQVFQVYPEGNAIRSSTESPFLQIGELKYGKPILDRGFNFETTLSEAMKFGLLSLDSTAKSNVSIGTPFEVFCYRTDSLVPGHRIKLEEHDPYLRTVRERWQAGLIQLVRDIPSYDFPA